MAKCNLSLPFPWLSSKLFAGHIRHTREKGILQGYGVHPVPYRLERVGWFSRNEVSDISCFHLYPESAGLCSLFSCMSDGWAARLIILDKICFPGTAQTPSFQIQCRPSPDSWTSPKLADELVSSYPIGLCCYLPRDDFFKTIYFYDFALQEWLRWIKIFGRLEVF